MTATGYFHKGTAHFTANIDSTAIWNSSLPSVVSVTQGAVRRVAGGSPDSIPVVAARNGVSDTCWVSAYPLVPRSQMNATASTFHSGFEPQHVIDSTRQEWLAEYLSPLPQSLILTLSKVFKIRGLIYLPPLYNPLGTYTQYRVVTSLDNVTFDTVATGTWPADTLTKVTSFAAVDAKYIWFTALDGYNGSASADEVGLISADTGTVIAQSGIQLLSNGFDASPNPFNPSLTIRYSVNKAGKVRISVYASSGKKIKTFKQGPQMAGHYEVVWDGLDGNGRSLASGVYLLELEGAGCTLHKRVTLLR
jgi:hypothetical protein